MSRHIWLVGAGSMAIDYIKVLKALNVSFNVIGRGMKSANECESKTGSKVIVGGLARCLCDCEQPPSSAIVAVNVEELANVTKTLLRAGVKKILVEKPGGLNANEICSVAEDTIKQDAEVYIAYNRRFYSSTRKAQQIIKDDGGVTSFYFEFTEWSHQIANINKAPEVKENWLLANSSHVIDLAFFLGGTPKKISCYKAGGLDWHQSGSIYAGAGVAESGALFSYQANWEAPGRWAVEVLTKKHRLILKPLEELYIQKIGSMATELMKCNGQIDVDFKPGLFLQTDLFLSNQYGSLLTIDAQCSNLNIYNKIIHGKETENIAGSK